MGMLLVGEIESSDNDSKSLTECKLYTARRTNTLTSFTGLPGRLRQWSKDMVYTMTCTNSALYMVIDIFSSKFLPYTSS
jgi:hypothetical protein